MAKNRVTRKLPQVPVEKVFNPIPMGAQINADPRDNPRWSEEEQRILTLEEFRAQKVR